MANLPPTPASSLNDRLCVVLFAVVLLAHAWCVHLDWNSAPLDAHDFRQTQTAISIRYLADDGLRLDYPTPILGKPWSVPLEFPVYQFAAAILVRHCGLSVEQAGRLTGLAFFYLTLPAIYLLAGRLQLKPARRLLVLAVILASPIYLFYPRAVLIETTALFFGLWFLWSLGESLDRPRSWLPLLAVTLAVLAALVKFTTFAALLPAAAWLWLARIRQPASPDSPTRLLLSVVAAAIVGGGLAAGSAWIAHTDTIKALNPLSDFLQAPALRQWGFGPFSLRFTPSFWLTLGDVLSVGLLRPACIGIGLVFFAMAPASLRYRCAGLLLCFLAGPLVFANVYFIHDYYYSSNAVFLLAAFGLALERALETPALSPLARWTIVTFALAASFAGYHDSYHRLLGNSHRAPELGRALKAITLPRDVLVIYGQDWNPVLPYTAGRRALMIPIPRQDDMTAQKKAWANLHDEHVGAVVFVGDLRKRRELVNSLIAEFNLSDKPVLTGNDTEVYAPVANASVASAVLSAMGLGQYKSDAQGGHVLLSDLPPESLPLFEMMSPRPREVTTQFGLGVYDLNGRHAFGSHPITQLVFDTKPGMRRVRAGFGLLDQSFANPLKSTDGVQFSIIWRKPDGTMVTLAERLLQPLQNERDRGFQEITAELPAHLAGDILLLTGPGPNGNFAFDWAYWTFITIE